MKEQRVHPRRRRSCGLPRGVARLLGALAAIATSRSILKAAGHPELTVMPIGAAAWQPGTTEVLYRLPEGPRGSFVQPIVFIAMQPSVSIPLTPVDPSQGGGETRQRTAAMVRFSVGGRKLPPWELQPVPTAYVLNEATVKSNPKAAEGALAITIELETKAPDVGVVVLGMPDPLLLSDTQDGPLASFISASKEPEMRSYFEALAEEVAGQKERARESYSRLRAAKDPRVGRLARRGARLMSYDFRERKLSGNFNEHFRWGLYLQQCALFEKARAEFDDCRIIDSKHAEAQFRGGETAEKSGATYVQVLDYMDRAAQAAAPPAYTEWYVLVVILRSRGGKELSGEEVFNLKDQVYMMQGNIWGATLGAVRVYVTYMQVASEKEWPFVLHDGKVLAPIDEVVARRGWFDSVFSVYPRLPTDPPFKILTLGGDRGLNGAAVSAIPHDALWIDLIRAWYEQYTWAADVGETGRGYPDLAGSIASGHPPTAHRGQACRAALHYSFSPAMHLRTKMADLPQPGSYVRMWRIEGPYPVSASAPVHGPPPKHVLEPIPAAPAPQAVNLVSDRDFIDLSKLFPRAGWARARATSYVFSPVDQEVRMWLGQNDGLAVWINGRCVHEGRYYSANKYEDRNLVDTIASYARLKRGWNEIRVVVEGWPAPRDKGWGFSMRFCSWDNKPIPGLAYVFDVPAEGCVTADAEPAVGSHYAWSAVQRDFTDALPLLGAEQLQRITGIGGLALEGDIQGSDGYFAIRASPPPSSPRFRTMEAQWRLGVDRDVVLNNVLDWARESCAALRYTKDGQPRDLLLLKPEAALAYLTLLREPADAARLFAGKPPADRLLGYCLAPAGGYPRTLLVVDCLLGETGIWPDDEEDLLEPLSPVFIPNKKKPRAAPKLPIPAPTTQP